MMPLWLARVLPWAALGAALGLVALYLRLAMRKVQIQRRPVLLVGFILGLVPCLYVGLVWAGLLDDYYLRIHRPLGTLITASAIGFIAWRLSEQSSRQSPRRRALVEALTIASALLAGLAICGPELGKPLNRLTILIAVDRSRSVDLVPGADARIRTELQAAEQSMREGDRIGVVAFAASAVTEDPPRPKSDLPAPQKIEIGRDGTDLAAAIRRALAEVPSDSASRIVVISDGVSNRGDPMAAAAGALAASVPVDTVLLEQQKVPDVRVVALRMPPRAHEGETLEMRLVTSSGAPADIEIRIKRDGVLVAQSNARVEAGEDVLRIRQKTPGPGLHRYDVEITSKDAQLDQAPEDNAGSAFVRVRGPSTALVLEGEPGKGAFLTRALQQANFTVVEGTTSAVPGDIGGLALYDVVFFSDIPAHNLSSAQIEALASYVRDLGGGLVLLGGDKSMGPGGYSQTPLEEVSPVSFDIKQDRRRASLAEVILIDYSGSMAASAGKNTKLELANEASARSAGLLGPGDRLGVAHVDTAVTWSVPLGPVTDQTAIAKAIRAVKPGGGGIYTDLALQAGYAALEKEHVNLKHALLFADGSDAEQLTGCRALVSSAKHKGITTSVVALGKGSDVTELETLSRLGDGRFYLIEDANRLPVVFTQETILASRSALNEVDFRVTLGASGPPTRGIDFGTAPILKGYVVTLPKSRASVLLSGPESDPVLATWSIGMGRAAVFTSDLKDRWGTQWTGWSPASSLVAQLARDVSRLADDPRVRLEADTVGGQLQVRAEVVGDDGRAQSFRRLTAHVAGPDGMTREVPLEPVGAGSYASTIELSRPGTYVVTAKDELNDEVVGTTGAVLTAGEEMRPTGSDRALLARLSSLTGGKSRDTLAGLFLDRSQKRFAYDPLSPWLLPLAGLLMLAGVGARRLSVPDAARKLGPKLRKILAPSKPKPIEQAVPRSPAATLEQLGKAKERSRMPTPAASITQPEASLAENPYLPPPAAPPPSQVPIMGAPARAPAAPISPAGAPSESQSGPGGRPLTAAEILLQKRRNRG